MVGAGSVPAAPGILSFGVFAVGDLWSKGLMAGVSVSLGLVATPFLLLGRETQSGVEWLGSSGS
jgi:hypothetical protein